jgi:hypothetical protein
VPRLSEKAPDLPYPRSLDQIIAAAMAKAPYQRLRPARELARQFRVALTEPQLNPDQPIYPVPTNNSSFTPGQNRPVGFNCEIETRVALPPAGIEQPMLSLGQPQASLSAGYYLQEVQAEATTVSTKPQRIGRGRNSPDNLS